MMTQDAMAELSKKYENAKKDGELLRQIDPTRSKSAAECIISLYAMFQISIGGKCGAFDHFEKVCGENRSAAVQGVKEMIEHAMRQATQNTISKYEEDELKAAILFYEQGMRERETKNAITPELSSLIGKLLADGANKITNLNMGRAGFLRDSFAEFNDGVDRFGSEEEVEDYLCSLIRAEIMGIPFENFSCRSLFEQEEKLDRFFSMIPLGLRDAVKIPENSVAESFKKCNPELFNERMPEWFYAGYLADKLNYNGRGAVLIAPCALYRSVPYSVSARRNMLENGRIAAVIEITNRKLYKNTGINASIVLLGKNCTSVRFVYADMCDNYDTHTLTENEIKAIVNACSGKELSAKFSNILSVTKTVGELLNDENKICSLVSRDYTTAEKQTGMKNLADYLPNETGKSKAIFRSRIFSSKDVNKNAIFTDEETSHKYIEIANLENGTIGGKIQNLEKMPDEYKNYLVEDGDIIISRAATPNYKIAIAEFGKNAPFKEGEDILPGGNLYVIRLDKSAASPYFIKAWFESDRGQKELKNISTSGVLNTLRVDKLRELSVPDATLEEQTKFTEEYKRFTAEIQQIKAQLDAKKEQLHNFAESKFTPAD